MTGRSLPTSRERLAPRRRPASSGAARLDVYDYHLSLLVVWTLLPAAERFGVRNLAVVALFALGTAGVLSTGTDGGRRLSHGTRFPGEVGTLDTGDAARSARLTAAGGALGWLLAWLTAPYHPLWTAWLALACLVGALAHTPVPRAGPRAVQAFALAGLGAGLILLPYGLLSGRLDASTVVQAALFGLGPLLFGLYAAIDEARPAVARLARPAVAALSGTDAVILTTAALTDSVPLWMPVLMLPTLLLRAGQFRMTMRRGDTLTARRLVIRAHRTSVAALIAANLLSAWLAG